jgi:hypothetical protein
MHSLLTGPALPIYGRRRYTFRKTCCQHSIAGNIRALLANLTDTASNDIVNLTSFNPGSLYNCCQYTCQQIYGVPVFPLAISPSHTCTHSGDYNCLSFGHKACSFACLFLDEKIHTSFSRTIVCQHDPFWQCENHAAFIPSKSRQNR